MSCGFANQYSPTALNMHGHVFDKLEGAETASADGSIRYAGATLVATRAL